MMRPPSITVTTRETRSRAICGRQATSTKWAPKDWVETFGLLFCPKVPSPEPEPLTRPSFSIRSSSSNRRAGALPPLRATRPFSKARSSASAPLNGLSLPEIAALISALPAASTAALIGSTRDAVSIEPPEIAPAGRRVSPSATSTWSVCSPRSSAAIRAATV